MTTNQKPEQKAKGKANKHKPDSGLYEYEYEATAETETDENVLTWRRACSSGCLLFSLFSVLRTEKITAPLENSAAARCAAAR